MSEDKINQKEKIIDTIDIKALDDFFDKIMEIKYGKPENKIEIISPSGGRYKNKSHLEIR